MLKHCPWNETNYLQFGFSSAKINFAARFDAIEIRAAYESNVGSGIDLDNKRRAVDG